VCSLLLICVQHVKCILKVDAASLQFCFIWVYGIKFVHLSLG